MALVREGSRLRVRIVDPIEGAKYTPSIDTLFQSAAKLAGKRVLGILLTGMGSDGKKGIAAIKAAGGKTIAEAEETAVIFGMPKEAIETGHIDLVCRLDEIAAEATAFAEEVSGSGTGIERPKRL